MFRLWLGVALVLMIGCAASPRRGGIVFLSRDGCANTPKMRANLEAALVSMGQPAGTYEFVDLDQVPGDDLRRGYPTPTILYAGHDIFGLREPTPPLPSPT